MDTRPKTIICDIDGTIVKHKLPTENCKPNIRLELLEGTIEKFSEWDQKGYFIILITGRKESLRKHTEKQLSEAGIFYDKLIMGIGGGKRVLINDCKPNGEDTALAFSLKRNKGIKDINI
ncbi:MAG: hypothetical protein CMC79_02855 [Flavobacteriaceae bacterium]|nr:hypothetical protein [Flavobacteriaceae bacterium]|tara:strand:- start:3263 stop:3622 length:360 start_codon:yes stop_codon:yes gene_type:complete